MLYITRLCVFSNLAIGRDEWELRLGFFARTGSFEPGLFLQSVVNCQDAKVRYIDLSDNRTGSINADLRDIVETEATGSFDTPPMIRAALVTLDGFEQVLVVTHNHVFTDGWSTRIIRKDIEMLYSHFRHGTPLAEPPNLSFPDFAYWQSRMVHESRFDGAIGYWQRKWAQFGSARIAFEDLPFCRRAPTVPTFEFGSETREIESASRVHLSSLTARSGLSMYMIFLAALSIVIHHYTGYAPIAVWSHFANRLEPKFREIVGFCANTHLLGIPISTNQRGSDLLLQVRRVVAEASDHQHLPLPHLWRVLRCHPRFPDVGLLISYRRTVRPSKIGSLEIDEVPLPASSSPRWSSLGVYVVDDGNYIRMRCQYARDRFNQTSIQHLLEDLRAVLIRLAIAPDATISSYASAAGRYSPRPNRPDGSMHEFLVLESHLIPRFRPKVVPNNTQGAGTSRGVAAVAEANA